MNMMLTSNDAVEAAYLYMANAMVESGRLDPRMMLQQVRRGSLVFFATVGDAQLSSSLRDKLKEKMHDHIDFERSRFRRMKTRAKKAGLSIERAPGVLPYGSTGREYIVKLVC